MKTARMSFVATILAITGLLLLPSESPAQKFLTKPIEFVVQSAAGGGSDIMARTMQAIIEKEKLSTHPITVVNRAGGSGAIAFAYVAGKKGDPHFWLTATTSFLQTPLQGQSKFNYKDFTPLGHLAWDDFLIVVRADAPYKNMKDLIAAAKKKPGELRYGGSSAPGADSIIAFLIEKASGVKFNYIPFKSGGEVMVALLGGHIDLASANPCEALAQMEAKKVAVLGVNTDKRLEGAANIPTLKEQGIDAVFRQFRSIAAPKDIPKEAVKYYEELLKKLSENKTWQEKYIKENMLSSEYVDSAGTFKVWERENAKFAKVMKEMGFIK
jgi:putative tricarboxylic transport membrane protein